MYENTIRKIVIENFMSLGYAELEFDKRNILNLCGYNDSGKSAVIRLLSVLFYDSHSTEQSSYIKDGTDYFKGTLIFSDGVHISKEKRRNGLSIWNMYMTDAKSGDTKVLYTNQLSSGIASVSGVPIQIQAYLGVLQDEFTGQLLNIRYNTDKMFLIYTSGGENYKMFSTILKSDVLAEASTQLIADKNRLSQDVQIKNNEYNMLVKQHNELETPTKATLAELDALTQQLTDLNKRNVLITGIVNNYNAMVDARLNTPAEVTPVDTTRFSQLANLSKLAEVTKTPIPEPVTNIDTTRISALTALMKNKEICETIKPYPQVANLDSSRYVALGKIGANIEKYMAEKLKLSHLEVEYKNVTAELADLAKKTGYKICKNCGSVVQ